MRRVNILRACPPAPKKRRESSAASEDRIRRVATSLAKRRLVFDDSGDAETACRSDNLTPPVSEDLEKDDSPVALPLADIPSPEGVATGSLGTDGLPEDCEGRDTACACDPLDRLLHCVEMMPSRPSGGRYCPVCHKERIRPLPASGQLGTPDHGSAEFCTHTSGSSEGVLLPNIPGLTCDVSIFKNLKCPMLRHDADGQGFWPVYVPKSESMCQNVCDAIGMLGPGSLAGKGAFGEVWRTRDGLRAAKKSKRMAEVLTTVWLSGVVRAKAANRGSRGNNIHFGILTSIDCCLRHRVTTSVYMYSDMYHYQGWSVNGVASYKRAFFGLANGLRFLSFECRISHLDITPMNILMQINPDFPHDIENAVLCDYSLSEPHPELNGKCVVVFQETMTAKLLPDSTFKLCESYHPAFRPAPLQRLVATNPHGLFPDGDVGRYCTAELCALANVAIFCLVRALDSRGVSVVMRLHEGMLFGSASAACEALERGDMQKYSYECLMILAKQLAYARLVLEEPCTNAIKKTSRFVNLTFRKQWSTDFRSTYATAYQAMSKDMLVGNLRVMMLSDCGSQLIGALRDAMQIASEGDLNVDPCTIFRSSP